MSPLFIYFVYLFCFHLSYILFVCIFHLLLLFLSFVSSLFTFQLFLLFLPFVVVGLRSVVAGVLGGWEDVCRDRKGSTKKEKRDVGTDGCALGRDDKRKGEQARTSSETRRGKRIAPARGQRSRYDAARQEELCGAERAKERKREGWERTHQQTSGATQQTKRIDGRWLGPVQVQP